jgi:hypothetical protein
LSLYDKATEFSNFDRTKIPRRKGDSRGKDPNRTIMSIRVDHIAELLANENATKLPVNYGFAKINFMPERMEGEAPTQEKTEQIPEVKTQIKRVNLQFMPENFDAIKKEDNSLLPLNEQPENLPVSGRLTAGQKNSIDELESYYKEKTPVIKKVISKPVKRNDLIKNIFDLNHQIIDGIDWYESRKGFLHSIEKSYSKILNHDKSYTIIEKSIVNKNGKKEKKEKKYKKYPNGEIEYL